MSAVCYAQPPFNNPAGEIVLRSRDGILFRIRKDIVIEASLVLAELTTRSLSDEQEASSDASSPATTDGKPIIDVPETSEVLDPLLRLCYPTADPVFADLQDVRLVLSAALKYQMEEATSVMKKTLMSYMEEQPLRVWAVACILHLEEEATEAATTLLSQEIPASTPPEFDVVSTGDYFRLNQFHRAGGKVAESFKFSEATPENAAMVVPHKESARERPSPYQSRPYADIICRSSDGVDFETHRIILAMSSPVLRDHMAAFFTNYPSVEAPLPSGSRGLPVIMMDAKAAVLGPVLEQCYALGYTGTRPLNLRVAISMTSCAQRYKMQNVCGFIQRCTSWHPPSSSHEALSGYLLASRKGLPDIAKEMLRHLRGDLFEYGYVPEMEKTPASVYHRLMINRRQSLAAMSKLTAVPPSPSPTRGAPVPPKPEPSTSSTPSTPERPKATTAPSTPTRTIEDPWLRGLWQSVVQGLTALGPGKRIYVPGIQQMFRESLQHKIWCKRCGPYVSTILEMQELYWKARSSVMHFDNKLS
ncbi:hypothetical protein L226DRAFT_569879 [Lentinus tigrinus ALCF2SS1-7]|uniref:BTB domain-containing protein n=1 Tax=Lentinus tigrinus ALCF2SS1-6 TaxID=1328759 RepID=A0A5C2SKZ4_9APHY|nr:hypothetical protein L227DRAFT_650582 [Lentinus tigrinus ALCF2SS1-6]RPD76643.1 hypothetical protein L226DRAFT_569879 [Lentinus tigrinus ALCF2SS1-7]